MPQIVQCPSCASKLQVPDEARKARCPKCSKVIEVGSKSAATAPASSKPAGPTPKKAPASAPSASPQRSAAAPQSQAAKKTVRCPKCQQPLKVPASAMGKTVKCPKCSHPFKVGAAAPKKPATPVQATPSSPDPFDDDDLFSSLPGDNAGQTPGPFDFDAAPSPPAGNSGFGGGYQQPYSAPATIHTTKARSSGGGWESWLTETSKLLMLMGIVAVACFVLSAIPFLGIAVFIVVAISYVIIQTVGGIWLLVIAFQEDVVQGILYLIVPFYALFYLITRWDRCRVAFMMCIVSVISFVSSFAGFLVGTMILGLIAGAAQ